VASKDRMARFGFDLIEWLCHEYGTKILVLDNQNQSPTEELGKDLLSIVQIYCCRWNGKRRYKNNKESEIENLSNQGTEKNIE
jgi:predicted site-specific integrase-resolvase